MNQIKNKIIIFNQQKQFSNKDRTYKLLMISKKEISKIYNNNNKIFLLNFQTNFKKVIMKAMQIFL